MAAQPYPRYLLVLWVVPAAVGTTSFAAKTPSPVMSVVVDESEAPRKIAFVHEEIPVAPGAVALAYPLWIPGEHGPTGPVHQFAALRIASGHSSLPWTRDLEEIATIHVDIPAATNLITVDFDTLIENTISDHQLLLAWNTVVLYPRGMDKTKLMVQPSVLLPANWKQASSLEVTDQTGVNFRPVSLERLIDSPVLAGEFLRVLPLSSSWPAELDVTGDSQATVDKADDAHAVDLLGKLIDQDRAMFGFRHWQKMHLLVSQSEAKPYDGLEHEDSPYSGVGNAGFRAACFFHP